ncbi:hypothetical protein BpHYR1_016839 [Brachionus plicatilis]|uniref:Uncharacterized protein n=1 Tax=Brachionus plicatilis TaxID=10195 RepID=A0A3M7PHH7_BRAPC|nr:hypothetical protein BpHYR1_016839 [Brachionus plicatilis]
MSVTDIERSEVPRMEFIFIRVKNTSLQLSQDVSLVLNVYVSISKRLTSEIQEEVGCITNFDVEVHPEKNFGKGDGEVPKPKVCGTVIETEIVAELKETSLSKDDLNMEAVENARALLKNKIEEVSAKSVLDLKPEKNSDLTQVHCLGRLLIGTIYLLAKFEFYLKTANCVHELSIWRPKRIEANRVDSSIDFKNINILGEKKELIYGPVDCVRFFRRQSVADISKLRTYRSVAFEPQVDFVEQWLECGKKWSETTKLVVHPVRPLLHNNQFILSPNKR